MEKKTVLIAEDAESNFMYLNILLRKDYNVIRAHDGKEAIDQFQTVKPDIVLLDIKMPGTDGLQALSAIRKMDANIPIVMQTAYAFDNDVENAMDLGASAYLTKPILKEKLFETLDTYLKSE